MTESLAEAGVEQWRVQNRAVKELMEEHEWFEPMVVVLGKGIVKTAPWGLMFRVIVGAILSVTDLGTDLLMLKQFADGGEKTATVRDLQLASLVASIVLQLLIVLIQNRRKGVNKLTRESLVVLTGMKAPWDAYRVACGAEQEKDTEIDPLMEMVFSKCAEMFAESIPGILIQLSAILGTLESAGGVVSLTAYTSLAVSMLTTGFVSATISYDFDVDPHKRAFNPGFYGYVPDAAFGRILVLVTLMGISACQVLIKSLFLVVLESKVERWVKEGWAVWEEEEPEWFSDRWKELVPVYMILAKGEIGLGMGGEDGEDEVEEERRKTKTKTKKSKVRPEGEGGFDVEDFKREMKRRGSING
ncbi:hypothetical protein TrLO_g9120 [Triparma laevis f. longispina]|uniref:Uncharacterized protein n=1 Tax=Triparma laevis f. longispina TaxID=1714387 RepID=A0A9W7E0W6_9STRA|nr:hypothetical protein TrLO_g9120 [Triparma laevis f. longispina]